MQKARKTVHNKETNQPIETYTALMQMLERADKDSKTVIISVFHMY